MPFGHASMLLLGEGSEATEPYNKYDKIRPHSIRSLQFDQKVRPLSFRPEKFNLFTATQLETTKALKKLKIEKKTSDFFSKFPVSRIVPKNVEGGRFGIF